MDGTRPRQEQTTTPGVSHISSHHDDTEARMSGGNKGKVETCSPVGDSRKHTFRHDDERDAHHPQECGDKFECEECGQVFRQKRNLKSHILIHTDEKNFKCEECGKMFRQRRNLKTHILTHTGEKAFECKECGKMFSQKRNLKTHILTHTGEKTFKCKECGKMFSQKRNLKSHMVMHTDQKKH